MGGGRNRTRRKQRQSHEGLQPRHGRECWQECWPTCRRSVYHAPGPGGQGTNGQENKWPAEYPFMQSMSRAGVPRRACGSRYGELEPAPTRIAEGRLGSNGQLDHPVVGGSGIEAGEYEVRFHLEEFFASGAGAGFLTVAPFRFRIEEVDEHFHLPMKFTRWGYSLFRGV